MAIKVKSGADSATRFVEQGAAAGGEYTAGVKGSGADWEANAAAAKEIYNAGVQEAISRDAYAKGIREAGAAHFESKASTVGARRFPEGIRAAKSDYQEGVEPFLDVIRGITQTPRRPRGDPGNYRRVEEIGMALRRRKVGG